jgi:hypothetical protein
MIEGTQKDWRAFRLGHLATVDYETPRLEDGIPFKEK